MSAINQVMENREHTTNELTLQLAKIKDTQKLQDLVPHQLQIMDTKLNILVEKLGEFTFKVTYPPIDASADAPPINILPYDEVDPEFSPKSLFSIATPMVRYDINISLVFLMITIYIEI